MRSPKREGMVVDLAKSSPQQTDVTHSTNGFPDAMSQSQPPSVPDDDVDPTNESHTCKDSSVFPSSSFPFSSSSPRLSLTTNHPSVLLQGVHGSHPHHHHDTTHLFQKLSLLDNTNPDTIKRNPRRKLPLSRLPASSSRLDGKNEREVKKSIIKKKKKRTPLKFKYYRHPGAIAAITSAMEALDTQGDDSKITAPVNGLDHSLAIRLKYNGPETASTTTTEEHATNSPVQHQRVENRDVMRIDSVLNDNSAQTMSSPPPSSSGSSAVASIDNASPSSPRAPSLNMSDRDNEHTNTDILDNISDHDNNYDPNNDLRSQFEKSGLREKYFGMLANPERQRYEDALVEIVGDLELPFFGDRFGSGHG
ncbi:hypothetical protein DPV78_004446 [Talaromyces pinophilus]|nr:hypothetical protein DPV78_004446 [Talaromyces pinophilus]